MVLEPWDAGQGATPDSNLVAVDFENVDLRVFIKFVVKSPDVYFSWTIGRWQVSVRFADKIPSITSLMC